jgi:hypothetical protein
MRLIGIVLVLLLLSLGTRAQLLPNLGGQRAGISSLTFLKNNVSPRSIGMGGFHTSLDGDGYSIYSNPAAMVDLEGLSLASSNYFIIQGLNQPYFSAILPTKGNNAWGFSATALSSGKIKKRTEFQPDGTGEYFYATSFATGLSFAKSLSDMFSFGLTIKYVQERIAEYTAHTGSIDLGFLYRTDVKDLQFAVILQNFGTNNSLSGDFLQIKVNRSQVNLEDNSPATVFKIGASFIPFKKENQELLVGVQLNHPNDNAENIRLGLEYNFRKIVFIRGGYRINIEGQSLPTFGLGVKTRIGRHPLLIDYGLKPTDYLGIQHVAGVTFILNNTKRSADE